MKHRIRIASVVGAVLGLAASAACLGADMLGSVRIDMPEETARLKPGPGMDTAVRSCMTCHSVDYVYMQPPLTKAQWEGEVNKMKKVYGAPFPASDIPVIVNYLMSQNGKP